MKEDIVLREDKRDLRFMSEVFLVTGQILTQIGGGSFLLIFLVGMWRLDMIPVGTLILMTPIGIFGGVILLIIGGLLKPRRDSNVGS